MELNRGKARFVRLFGFNSKIKSFGILAFCAFMLLFISIIAPVSHKEEQASATGGNTAPTLTITPSNSANLSLIPGVFNSVSQTVNVSTTNTTGYTLTFVASGNSSDLIYSGNSNIAIPSILSTTSSSNFNNNYGWKKNSEASYRVVPVTTPEALAITNSANVTADTYTLTFGAMVDDSYDEGSYVKEFIVSATANPVDFTITYHANTNDTVTGMPSDNPHIVPYDYSSITLPSNQLTRVGYTFLGWDEDDTATTATYAPGDTLPLNSSIETEIDLYAIWEQDSCSAGYICYFSNGATSGTMSDQSVTSDTDITLIPPNYARTGYGFAGWNTIADGSGTDYGPGENYHVGDVTSSGIILYARWVPSTGYFQTWNGCSNLNTNDVVALTDSRDGSTYAVAKLADGGCWMTENLRLNFTNATITTLNTHGPTNDFVTEARSATSSATFCSTDDSACDDQIQYNTNNLNRSMTQTHDDYSQSSSWYSYGVYYNWYTATAGNGTYSKNSGAVSGDICPAGWHLPTGSGGEFGALNTAANAGRTNKDFGLRAYPVNFVWSGDISADLGHNIYGRIWTANSGGMQKAFRMGYSVSSSTPSGKTWNKWSGFVVRCKYQGSSNTFHTVTVNLDTGVSSVTFSSVDYGTETVTANGGTVNLVDDASYTMTANMEPNYGFASWTGAAGGTIDDTASNPTSIIVTDDTTVSVSATILTNYIVTVNLDSNSTAVSFSNSTYGTKQVTTNGGNVALYANIEYSITPSFTSGYTFDTWTVTNNGTLSNANSANTLLTITGDTTLSLTSKEIVPETYTLIYNIGTGATDGPANDTGSSMDGYYIFTVSSIIPYRPGYSFLGWTRTENSSTVDFIGGNTYTITDTTATLYAIWVEDTCAVSHICYFGNHATSGTMTSQSANSNADVNLIPSNFARTGYGFAGWNTMPDGSGTTLGPNAKYHTGDLSGAGLKLYAMWVPSSGSFQTWNGCSSLSSHSVIGLTDLRDNNVYAVAKLDDDNCWMIENLRLDPSTANITALNTHNPADGFASLARQSSSDVTLCNTTGSTCTDQLQYNTNNLNRNLTQSHNTAANNVAWYSYGVYYNWYTATAGNGTTSVASGTVAGDICPAGWHLPTGNGGEWVGLNTSENNGVTNSDAGLRAYPVNLIWSGDYNNNKRTNGFSNGRYWSRTAFDADNVYRMGFANNTVTPNGNYRKWDAFTIRCVFDGNFLTTHEVTVTLPQNVNSVSFYNATYGTEVATSESLAVTLVDGVDYVVTADFESGYELDTWTAGANGTLTSTSTNPTTFSVTDDTTLTLTETPTS